MEEADIDQLLTNAAKVNWLKGVLVMEITDEAIRPFVDREVTRFHNEIKANFRHGSLCGNCSSTNAKNCGICSDITSQIVSVHRFSRPCYTNSDITKWLSDPWEIAKCYMSKSKDLEGKPECDLDYASILNVVINNTRFQRLITGVNMADSSNIFNKGRVARNDTMHSRWHQTLDTDLKDYCDNFIEIVKLTVADSEQYVKKIEKVRDTPLSITAEEIVKLKKLAARSEGMTEEVIKEMKTKMWDETKQVVQYIRDEAEKVNGTSLMANFIEGCKESLYKLTVDHIRQQKPDHITEDEWTIEKFVECLNLFPENNTLSPRHFSILFRKTHTEEDIRKWDLFLLCFILKIELRIPVSNNVLLYVKDVIEVRDELYHNGVAANELSILCDYLDEPLKSDILRIFNKKYNVRDTSQASVILISWLGEEKDFSNKRIYLAKDVKKDHEKDEQIIVLQKDVDTLKQQVAILNSLLKIPHETNQVEEMIDKGATGGIAYGAVVEVVPTNIPPHLKKMVQMMMTSFKQNNEILNNGEIDHLNKTLGCMTKGFDFGSIILKVECPTVEKLVEFWKGCTDGTVVKAMSKIRDAYRRHLGNDELEFEIILKKKEVTRRRNKIIEDLNAHMKQLKGQVTDVIDFICRPETNLEEEMIDEGATGGIAVAYDVESVTDLQKDTDPVQTSESYIHDDVQPKTRIDEEAEKSDQENLDGVKSETMIVEEPLLISDAVKSLPKMKPLEMPITSGDDPEEMPFFGRDDVQPKTGIDEEAEKSDQENLDDGEPPLKTCTDEEVDSSDQESLDDVKSETMIVEEPLLISDAVRSLPKMKPLEMPITSGDDPNEMPFFGQDAAKPKIKPLEMPSTSDAVKHLPKIKPQEMPSTSGLPAMKYIGYGEEEASRLVKFLRQISESLGGGNISTVKQYIRDIVDHAKEDRKEGFDKSINDFTKMAMFKGGISINLIKQAIRGFDMIKEQPQFGDLVTSKLDAIEKEISEQNVKGTTRSQEKPLIEPSAVKTSVSIAEDTEVDESERPRPQASKILGKPITKPSEKEVKSSMVSDSDDASFKRFPKEGDVFMKPSGSTKLTSEETDAFKKKRMSTSPESTHQSSAKGTEEQTTQGPLIPEESKS